ncbi:hypothetical protein AB0O34_10495 [Sphaerisporangium sp. NPDC088356]
MLDRALRRRCVSALLDPEITPAEPRVQLEGIVAAFTSVTLAPR